MGQIPTEREHLEGFDPLNVKSIGTPLCTVQHEDKNIIDSA